MALVTRISRLFQADFHAVLDRIEEPDLQLRQAVREMQYALEQDRQRLLQLQHEAQQLDKAIRVVENKLISYDEELDLCLAANEESLARDLVRRKLAAIRQQQECAERRRTLEQQTTDLATQVEEQSAQLTSMQQKLELLVQPGDPGDVTSPPSIDAIRDEEIEIALLREKQRRLKS